MTDAQQPQTADTTPSGRGPDTQAEQEREKLRALIEARTLDKARLRDNLAAMRVALEALVSVGESLATGG